MKLIFIKPSSKRGERRDMVNTYVVLMKLTDKGVKNISKAPMRIEENNKKLEQAGGRVVNLYFTMGEYDYVVIIEAPDDEVMMKHLLEVVADSAVKTLTMKAFPQEQFFKILEK